jgi:hypothetical protein
MLQKKHLLIKLVYSYVAGWFAAPKMYDVITCLKSHYRHKICHRKKRRFGNMEAGNLVSETVMTLPSANVNLMVRHINNYRELRKFHLTVPRYWEA